MTFGRLAVAVAPPELGFVSTSRSYPVVVPNRMLLTKVAVAGLALPTPPELSWARPNTPSRWSGCASYAAR